jgi:peptide methionine sulfoxide reductase MsrA
MKNVIKELKAARRHELKQIGMTPRTSFIGTQKEHDNLHRQKANEYQDAIKILSAKFEIRAWLPPEVENFPNYTDANKYYKDYVSKRKNEECDVQLLGVIQEFNNVK